MCWESVRQEAGDSFDVVNRERTVAKDQVGQLGGPADPYPLPNADLPVGALRRCRRGLWIVRKELGYPAESTGSPRLLDLPLTLGVPTFELLASGGARGSASIGGGSTSGTTGFGGGAGTGGASGMVAGVGGSVAGGATLSTHWRHVTCLAALSHCARVPAGRTLRNRNKHRHASGPLPSSPRGRRYHNGRVGRPPHCRAHGRFVRWWVARFAGRNDSSGASERRYGGCCGFGSAARTGGPG